MFGYDELPDCTECPDDCVDMSAFLATENPDRHEEEMFGYDEGIEAIDPSKTGLVPQAMVSSVKVDVSRSWVYPIQITMENSKNQPGKFSHVSTMRSLVGDYIEQ